jgi:hypothetical protein
LALTDSFGSDDFSGVFLSVCHHSRAVVISDLSVVKLYNTDGVVIVVVFFEVGLDSRNAMG